MFAEIINVGSITIIVILVVIVLIALKGSLKHYRGEGGCCGGVGEVKVKKQKLKHIFGKKEISIEGMKCDNCRRRIENGLNSMYMVNAKVDLGKKVAYINLGEEIPDKLLKEEVEKLGYKVADIRNV